VDDDDIVRLDATGQAELVADGVVSAGELVEAAIRRVEALDPTLGVMVAERFDAARAEAAGAAAGPFRGVPFLVKDGVQQSAGDRYQHGTRLLRDHPFVPDEDTELVRRYRAAGFVIVGRSKVPELTMSPTTEPLAHGPTHNPWALDRSPGGSSGGSAAAVAAGLVPVAHGNDMGGSIRVPASCCGLVGLKPSRARTSLAPHWGQYWGPLTHEHVLTRSVRDTAAVLDATAGPVPGDLYQAPPPDRPWLDEVGAEPGQLRVGLVLDAPLDAPVDDECRLAAERTARLLESMGHTVEPLAGSLLADQEGAAAFGAVIAAGVARDITAWEQRAGASAELEPLVEMSVARGRAMAATEYVEAIDALARWSRRIAAVTGGVDVVLSPTMAVLPPKLGTLSGDQPLEVAGPGWSAMATFAIPFDVSGQPAVSLPLHWTPEGLPVGVQLAAAYGREDVLVRLAARLEGAQPWAQRWPAVSGL
jgi:amidase